MLARSGLVEKNILAPFGAIPGEFVHGPEKTLKTVYLFAYFPWWANGYYSTGLGQQNGKHLRKDIVPGMLGYVHALQGCLVMR